MSTGDAAKVAELAERASLKPHTITVTHEGLSAQVLLVPNGVGGYDARDVKAMLEPYRTAPERRKGTARLTDLNSFIAHVNRFKDEDSLIFMVRKPSPTLVGVVDYHRMGSGGAPRFGTHRSEYAFPLSDEWNAWTSQDGKPMAQEAFARWLEDHLMDVADPNNAGESAKAFVALLSCGFASASKLLELSRGLDIHVGRRVKQHVRLASGETTVSFEESHSDANGAPLKVPGAFLLGIPVFRGGDPYQLATRLRYRVSSGQVTWSYEIHQASRVLDHALNEACEEVTERTGLEVLEGTPEA